MNHNRVFKSRDEIIDEIIKDAMPTHIEDLERYIAEVMKSGCVGKPLDDLSNEELMEAYYDQFQWRHVRGDRFEYENIVIVVETE